MFYPICGVWGSPEGENPPMVHLRKISPCKHGQILQADSARQNHKTKNTKTNITSSHNRSRLSMMIYSWLVFCAGWGPSGGLCACVRWVCGGCAYVWVVHFQNAPPMHHQKSPNPSYAFPMHFSLMVHLKKCTTLFSLPHTIFF